MATPTQRNTFIPHTEIGGQLITIDVTIQRDENKRHGMVAHTCNPKTWLSGDRKNQNLRSFLATQQVHSFLGNMRHCLIRNNKTTGRQGLHQ